MDTSTSTPKERIGGIGGYRFGWMISKGFIQRLPRQHILIDVIYGLKAYEDRMHAAEFVAAILSDLALDEPDVYLEKNLRDSCSAWRDVDLDATPIHKPVIVFRHNIASAVFPFMDLDVRKTLHAWLTAYKRNLSQDMRLPVVTKVKPY